MSTMIISVSYRETTKGNGWTVMSRTSLKDTNIINKLENLCRENKSKTLEELTDMIKDYYKNKTEKSDAYILYNKGSIEVFKPSGTGFPQFYVVRDTNS